jgi:hypothetical protein
MDNLLHAFNESFRVRAQPKRNSVLNTEFCEITFREMLLLVVVPNKHPLQLQWLLVCGIGQQSALRPSKTFLS